MKKRILALCTAMIVAALTSCDPSNHNSENGSVDDSIPNTGLVEDSQDVGDSFEDSAPAVKTLTEIEMDNYPKTQYEVGEEFDLEGGTILLHYSDGSVENLTITLEMVEEVPDLTSAGTKEVKIDYQGFSTSYNIHVSAVKVEPTLTWSFEPNQIFKYNGTGEAPNISVSVNEDGVDSEVYFSKDEQNIGTAVPTTPGTYSLVIETTENDLYKSIHKWRNFQIINKEQPTVTFNYDNGQNFVYDGTGVEPDIHATVTAGVEYDWWFESETLGVLGKEVPTTPGTYSLVVQTVENSDYASFRVWQWFRISAPTVKIEPVVIFTPSESGVHFVYDGTGEVPNVSVTVESEVEWDWWFELNEVNIGKTFPTEPNTYSIVVKTEENATYKGVRLYRWFVVEAPTEKLDPVYSFSFEPSQIFEYDGSGTAPDISVTVESDVTYEWHFEKDEVNIGQEIPTEPGHYALVVDMKENDNFKAKKDWRVFQIQTPTVKLDPVYSFSFEPSQIFEYDGSGTAPDISVKVESDVTYEWRFEKEEVNIGQEIPTEPGYYALVVDMKENENYKAKFDYRVFQIKAPTVKLDPVYSFSFEPSQIFEYDGSGTAPDISVKVESDVTYEWRFEKEEVNIGQEIPTEPGHYALVVEMKENDNFKAKKDWRVFQIVEPSLKVDPTITFSFEKRQKFEYDGTGEIPNITVLVEPSTVEYTWWYEDQGTNLGHNLPTTPGVYALVVETVENDDYKKVSKYELFDIVAPTGEVSLKKSFTAVTRAWGNDGNNGVYGKHVTFDENKVVTIKIDGSTRTGGALESNDFYDQGSFEIKAKTTSKSGVATAFWTFYYEDNGNINHEIDIELFGDNNVIYSSYTSEDNGFHINDKTDFIISDNEEHTYRFDWYRGEKVEYYIDGQLKATIVENVPNLPMKVWIGAWCPSWAGAPKNEISYMTISSFKYTSFN